MMMSSKTYVSFVGLQSYAKMEEDAGCVHPANHGADFPLASVTAFVRKN